MNRLIIAGVIFAIILTLCTGAAIIANNQFESVKNELNLCVNEFDKGNNEKSLELADTLHKRWLKIEQSLSVIMNHGKIDDIRIHFARLKAYLQSQNEAGFKSEAAELFTLIDQLEEDEKVTVHSIF